MAITYWSQPGILFFVILVFNNLSDFLLFSISFEARFTLATAGGYKLAIAATYVVFLCVWLSGTSSCLVFIHGGSLVVGLSDKTLIKIQIALHAVSKMQQWMALILALFARQSDYHKRTRSESSATDFDPTSSRLLVIIPCYRESHEHIVRAVKTVLESENLSVAKHVFISFDGFKERMVYESVLKHFILDSNAISLRNSKDSSSVQYHGSMITLSLFEHGGKRACQVHTLNVIHNKFKHYLDEAASSYLLFLDSDTYVENKAISRLVSKLNEKTPNGKPYQAVTGPLLAVSAQRSWLVFLQQIDYLAIYTTALLPQHYFLRIPCYPGAFSLFRLSAFLAAAPEYFLDISQSRRSLYMYWFREMGDDRFITWLVYPATICTNAFCYTEAVTTTTAYFGQRRRWHLAYLSNEVYGITRFDLWMHSPKQVIARLLNATTVVSDPQILCLFIWSFCADGALARQDRGTILLLIATTWILCLAWSLQNKIYSLAFYPLYFIAEACLAVIRRIHTACTYNRWFWGGAREQLPSFSEHDELRSSSYDGTQAL